MIFITGASGFIGKNLIKKISNEYKFHLFKRSEQILIPKVCHTVIHLAGKAHDLKKIQSPDEYYKSNYFLTKKIFDAFLISNAKCFIFLSSVKAIADKVSGNLFEDFNPNPKTHYGKSKLLAENYIFSKSKLKSKRVYVLRPSMIYGFGNKGNLNLLYNFVAKGIPWPLGMYDNKRSYCSINNLIFIIRELIKSQNIPSGAYNVCDDSYLSTNEIIKLINESKNKRSIILNVPKKIISFLANLGDLIPLFINSERLEKLTESYLVNNDKIKNALKKPLPYQLRTEMINLFKSLNDD